jgi:Tfp pilus assembly protein PilN
MSKINLLPWREENRQVRNRIFYVITGVAAACSILLIVLVSIFLDWRTGAQNANIEYLNKELDSIKVEITEIQGLQESKKQLLDRMTIIQSLQADRPSIVQLLDLLPRVVPEDIYLTTVTRRVSKPEELPPPPAAPEANTANLMKNMLSSESTIVKPVAQPTNLYIVTIDGVAQSNGIISNFLKRLEEVKWLSGIRLVEVAINKENTGLNFKLEFMQNLSKKGQ